MSVHEFGVENEDRSWVRSLPHVPVDELRLKKLGFDVEELLTKGLIYHYLPRNEWTSTLYVVPQVLQLIVPEPMVAKGDDGRCFE
jgi:hypothetical protein